MYKFLLSFFLILFTTETFALGLGNIGLPLEIGEHIVSVDAIGLFGHETGIAAQGRYTRRIGDLFTLDVGAGLGSGKRHDNLFLGADLEIFPDYMEQPRFSVKTSIELTDVGDADDQHRFEGGATALSMAPTLSKMLVIADLTTYPYLSLPIGLNLFRTYDVYEANLAFALGIASWITLGGTDNVEETIGPLAFNAELRLNLSKADTAFILGIGWKLP